MGVLDVMKGDTRILDYSSYGERVLSSKILERRGFSGFRGDRTDVDLEKCASHVTQLPP